MIQVTLAKTKKFNANFTITILAKRLINREISVSTKIYIQIYGTGDKRIELHQFDG